MKGEHVQRAVLPLIFGVHLSRTQPGDNKRGEQFSAHLFALTGPTELRLLGELEQRCMFETRPFAQIELESLAGILVCLGCLPVELVVAIA